MLEIQSYIYNDIQHAIASIPIGRSPTVRLTQGNHLYVTDFQIMPSWRFSDVIVKVINDVDL